MPRPTAASARRSEYDSAAAVAGSDRTLTLNVEMASSKVQSWEACNRFVAHFKAFTRIAIVSNLVPCTSTAERWPKTKNYGKEALFHHPKPSATGRPLIPTIEFVPKPGAPESWNSANYAPRASVIAPGLGKPFERSQVIERTVVLYRPSAALRSSSSIENLLGCARSRRLLFVRLTMGTPAAAAVGATGGGASTAVVVASAPGVLAPCRQRQRPLQAQQWPPGHSFRPTLGGKIAPRWGPTNDAALHKLGSLRRTNCFFSFLAFFRLGFLERA